MAKNALKKSELKKMPLQLATEYVVSQAKRYEKIKYFVKAAVHIVNHHRVLILSVYQRDKLLFGIKEPLFRTFMTKKDYTTQYFDGDSFTWRTSRFERLVETYWYSEKKLMAFCDTTSEKTVQNFLKHAENKRTEKNAYRLLLQAQDLVMAKRLENKHKIIKKRIDGKMREIKPLPKDFTFWIDEVAMAKSRYIYYRYSRKKNMDGYCTHCHQEVTVQGAKHQSTGTCPSCGVKVTFLAEGKARNVYDEGEAAYFQKTKNGFVIRYFSISKHYQNYREPKISVTELNRNFYEGDSIERYEFYKFKNTNQFRWCDARCQSSYSFYMFYKPPFDSVATPAVYTKNLNNILENTEYKYCKLKEFAERYEGAPVVPHSYLGMYKKIPALEYFVKSQLYNIAYQLTSNAFVSYSSQLQINKNSLHEMLDIKKWELPFVRACDMSLAELQIYKQLKECREKLSVEEFKRFCSTYNIYEYGALQTIFVLLKYTTLHKAERYCRQFIDENHDIYNVQHTWSDYLKFCTELGYDTKNTFVLFPKNLEKAHAAATRDVMSKRDAERKAQIEEEERKSKILLKKYQSIYAWKEKKFAVIVPKDLLEIKEEGYTLHHCVGTYTSKVADGTSIILFVRSLESPEKPFYTLELVNNKIRQCRGYRNKDMVPDVKEFIERYKDTVLMNLQEQMIA